MIYTLTLNPAVDRELTVPAMEFDSVLRASESRVDFGGKGFNVSRLLKGMDEPSVAVGFLGGNAGELLQKGLQSLGIGTDFVWVDGETRTNVSVVTQSHDHYIKVNEKGPLPGRPIFPVARWRLMMARFLATPLVLWLTPIVHMLNASADWPNQNAAR